MSEIRVRVNLDEMTLADYADLQRGKVTAMLAKCTSVQGYASVRDVPISALKAVTDALLTAIQKLSTDELISPVAADDIVVSSLENMLIGDLEAMETGTKLVDVFQKFITVRGYPDVGAVPFKAIGLIREKLADAIGAIADPNA